MGISRNGDRQHLEVAASRIKKAPRLGAAALALSMASAGLATPRPAQAWEVSTTHLDLSEAALLASSTHRAWMDASGMRLGLFSRLSLDPAFLGPKQRWDLEKAMETLPSRAMARPRGGEPLCPPDEKDKPKAQCLEHRPWSQDALAWMRLGVITAAYEPHQLLDHMALPLPDEPRELPRWFRKVQHRHNGAPIASTLAGPAPLRENGPMKLLSRRSGWSLRDLSATMAATALAPTPQGREQALVQSMILWGMAMHLVQDQTLPAMARGELAAMFEPLSKHPQDRGSALSHWVGTRMQRSEIDALAQEARLPEILGTPSTWSSLVSRQSKTPSLPRWVAHHFVSPAVFPPAMTVDWSADPKQAANELFSGTSLHLRSAEREGLTLQGWPAPAGYLATASNRILASYARNAEGQVELFEDPAVFAENAAQLLSVAMAASMSMLNRAFELPPKGVSDPGQSKLWREAWVAPRALMLQESPDGIRRVVARWNNSLPSNAKIAAAQAQASKDGALPIFVVYEGQGTLLPRLLHWRLPSASTQAKPASPAKAESTPQEPAQQDPKSN